MNSPIELPMRIVGKKQKSAQERFSEIQRHGRLYRRRRQARIEVQQPDGTWVPYVRAKPVGAA